MKNIVVLGSTGSIGVSALDVIKNLGPDFKVLAITANKNTKLFLEQVKTFAPLYAVVYDKESYKQVQPLMPETTKLLEPDIESLNFLAALPEADLVINGLVGSIGFLPLISAIKAGKTIALANKEPIVMAGATIMQECQRWNATILPVDSEPSAVFQCLENVDSRSYHKAEGVSKILLTASGGPFFKYQGALDEVTPEQALKHPRWKMGKKITVDSATLMNKGFETIEIMHLFNLPLEKVKIVIHPQSIVHSAVEYVDGSILADLSNPDMRLPIQYAITYPQRLPSPVNKLSLLEMQHLDFYEPDFSRFPCLALALDAIKKGGAYPAVVNGADEVAVAAFLDGRILFTDIAKVIAHTVNLFKPTAGPLTLHGAAEINEWAKLTAEESIKTQNYKKENI